MYVFYSLLGVLLFIYIVVIGSALAKLFNIAMKHAVILGVLATSTLQWCLAMPLQFFHANWLVYYYSMLIQTIILLILAMIIHRRLKSKINLLNYCRYHWFVWIMAIVSSCISWVDTIPYNLYNYYDDGFYLSRIGTQINASQLANYDNYTGIISHLTLDRVLTTYEIKYSFWIALFHVDLIPFMRISAVVLSYLLIYHLLLWCIVQLSLIPRYWAQFVLSSLLIYLVSAAYLGYIGFFRSWDNWQFISASYFGGNFVRVLALPLFIGLSYFYRTNKSLIINISLYITLCITLISYSSMAISYIIIGSMIIYLVNRRYLATVKLSKLSLVFIISLFLINTYLGMPRLLNHLYYFNDVYIEYLKTFVRIYSVSLLLLLGLGYYYLPPVIKNKLFIPISILVSVIIGSITYIFVPIMLLLSSGYMFVAARLGTSIQILLVLITMIICLYHALNCRKEKYMIMYQVLLFSILFVLTYFTMPMSHCSLQRNGCQVPNISMLALSQPQTHNEITRLHQWIEKQHINGAFIVPNVVEAKGYDIQLAVQIRTVKGIQPTILNLYDKNKLDDMLIDEIESYLLGYNHFLTPNAKTLFKKADYILVADTQLDNLITEGFNYQVQLAVTFNQEKYSLIKIIKSE